jgi:hypothetical protein
VLAGFFGIAEIGVRSVDRAQGEGEQGEGIGVKGSGARVGVAGAVARAKRRRPLWVRTRVT